jgi:putative glutamine amidotransferase
MSYPVIGITTRQTMNTTDDIPLVASPKSYIQALSRAGAAPVLIPVGVPDAGIGQLLDSLDGLMFTGGGDIETARFAGEDHPEVYDVDTERDEMEIKLVHAAVLKGLPFLGICRGIQIINVAFGGSLYTHIADQHPDAIQHRFYPGHPWDYLAHSVELDKDCRLAGIFGKTQVQVNSLHHQGIRQVPSMLEVVGRSPDGLVEALEMPGHPFGLAVQWHPEWLPEDPHSQALFKAFVDASDGKRT